MNGKGIKNKEMNVRLTDHQKQALQDCFKRSFRAYDRIFLFGSRVDPNKKGGDIDLYIETHIKNAEELVKKKQTFLYDVQRMIGEQKIDVVIKRLYEDQELPICKEAKTTGVLLVGQNDFLLDYIKIVDIQADRLQLALSKLAEIMPFTQEKLTNIEANTLGFLEILTARFAKIQNMLGSKIFPLILQELQEDRPDYTLIDRLNKLEKLEYLYSTSWWDNLRDIRNSIAHDYPTEYLTMSDQLNACAAASKELLSYWAELKAKMQSAKLI